MKNNILMIIIISMFCLSLKKIDALNIENPEEISVLQCKKIKSWKKIFSSFVPSVFKKQKDHVEDLNYMPLKQFSYKKMKQQERQLEDFTGKKNKQDMLNLWLAQQVECQEDLNGLDCPICFNAVESVDRFSLHCGHVYHKACFELMRQYPSFQGCSRCERPLGSLARIQTKKAEPSCCGCITFLFLSYCACFACYCILMEYIG